MSFFLKSALEVVAEKVNCSLIYMLAVEEEDMERLLEYLSKEWRVVSEAPFTFLILAAIVFGIAFLAVQWSYKSIIEKKNATIETLKERLYLKTEQAEQYKDRALKYDEKVLEVVDSSEVVLKEKALELVRKLRDFVERYKREDDRVSSEERQAMREASSEEDKSKAWTKFTNESSRLSNERNTEYDRRFKIDAILLRDELRSRLTSYEPLEKHIDSTYEHPTNYFGFNKVADDLERMAKLLTNGST